MIQYIDKYTKPLLPQTPYIFINIYIYRYIYSYAHYLRFLRFLCFREVLFSFFVFSITAAYLRRGEVVGMPASQSGQQTNEIYT